MTAPEGISAYPLQWPAGWRRTQPYRQNRAQFKMSFARARDTLVAELARMGAQKVIVSSNIPIKPDGLPYATYTKPKDNGVAVYFHVRKKVPGKVLSPEIQMVLACDRWDLVEHNLHAISLTIAALRGIDRWGASEMLERAFTGFLALPAPIELGGGARPWWEVLGVSQSASLEARKEARNRLLRIYHPDNGTEPSDAKAAEVNEAYQQSVISMGGNENGREGPRAGA